MSTIGSKSRLLWMADVEFPPKNPLLAESSLVLLAASWIIVGIGFGVAEKKRSYWVLLGNMYIN